MSVNSTVLPRETEVLRGNSISAAGWLLFVTIITMIVEGLILACRFLNFGFMKKLGIIANIVVSNSILHDYLYVTVYHILSEASA